jgi:hypothetical protein
VKSLVHFSNVPPAVPLRFQHKPNCEIKTGSKHQGSIASTKTGCTNLLLDPTVCRSVDKFAPVAIFAPQVLTKQKASDHIEMQPLA